MSQILSSITNEQFKELALVFKTAGGNPATVDGVPSWAVLSGTGTLIVAEDGLSAKIVSGDASELVEVEVSADADLGEGVQPIVLNFTQPVTIAQADATTSGAVEGTAGFKSDLA